MPKAKRPILHERAKDVGIIYGALTLFSACFGWFIIGNVTGDHQVGLFEAPQLFLLIAIVSGLYFLLIYGGMSDVHSVTLYPTYALIKRMYGGVVRVNYSDILETSYRHVEIEDSEWLEFRLFTTKGSFMPGDGRFPNSARIREHLNQYGTALPDHNPLIPPYDNLLLRIVLSAYFSLLLLVAVLLY